MHDGTKRLLLTLACFAVAVLLYILSKPQPRESVPADAPPAAETPRAPVHTQSSMPSDAGKPTESSVPAESAEMASQPSAAAPALPASNPVPVDPDGPAPSAEPLPGLPADPAQDLEGVQTIMRDFRTALGGNPVGTNAEITGALLGDNLKQVKLSVPIGSSVNKDGELVDRWGTPYFFHQLSAEEMEIRSAGPDRKMWTGDDRQVK